MSCFCLFSDLDKDSNNNGETLSAWDCSFGNSFKFVSLASHPVSTPKMIKRVISFFKFIPHFSGHPSGYPVINCMTLDSINWFLAFFILGACNGEHGVGVGKIKYQRKEHGEALDVMQAMKQVMDPNGILNPGKIFGK
ncbi:hypothetical protein A616_30800 [Brevibacillus brevis X23]|nr:hypothetical protein A616_30800 [Brevibacillus brevis X23]